MKKFVSIFVVLGLILLPLHVKAEETAQVEGRIVSVDKGQEAPYSGILLDSAAAAKVTADKKFSLLREELKLDYELKKQAAEFQVQIDSLKVSLDTQKEKSDSLLELKNSEIDRLQDLIKEDPNDWTPLWFAGGAVVGILLSIGIFYAAVEVSK